MIMRRTVWIGPPRIIESALFVAAVLSIAAADANAQTQPTIWNGFSGSQSTYIGFSGYTNVFGNSTFPGTPNLSVSVNGSATQSAIFDTGSTGLAIDVNEACGAKMIQCTGSAGNWNYSQALQPANGFLGWNTITYTSSQLSYTGFYTTANVTLSDKNGTAMAQAQVPVFITVTGGALSQLGVGFGRPENDNGVSLYSTQQDAQNKTNPIGTLYGKTINPLLNLTQLNAGSGLSNIPSSIAPGYVVTANGVYLGLSQSVLSQIGASGWPGVKLTALSQSSASQVSAYATMATKNDWATPPILMQVSNNTASLNGSYYGSMVVDTGINNAIIGTGTAASVNKALVQSTTPTSITIGLGGTASAGNQQPGQFTYVYQGICSRNTTNNVGCGPPQPAGNTDLKPYNGNQGSQIIPTYPISSGDSFSGGYNNTNTGFQDSAGTPNAYLNTGVNFLSYFNVVYDPVSGFIGYQPVSNTSSSLLSTSSMLALQGSLNIPAGTNVNQQVFLFTAIGGDTQTTTCTQANQTGCTPVDVILSTPGVVTFSQPIASDLIANCTGNCSTGLVLNQGTFVLNANNTYAGATAVNSGASLLVNGSIAPSSGVTVNSGGTLAGAGTVPTTTINAGGTLAPGTPGAPGTFMTVTGDLAFQSGAFYLVNIGPTAASGANVAGNVTLNGTVLGYLAPGSYSTKTTYGILDPTNLAGKFAGFLAINAPGFGGTLAYTPTDVVLNLTANLGGGGGLNGNQQSVANGINGYFNNGGTLPANFFQVFGMSGGALGNALSQIDGEANTGAERAALQLTNQFLALMLDPFVYGRGGVGSTSTAIGFAPDEQTNLPPDIALAYASIVNKSPKPPTFEQRWTAWGSAFGGSNTANGNAVAGSSNITASAYGFAAGMDYHLSPHTVVGFALAGAGTNWGLATTPGSGRSDAMQIGGYGITWFGAAYLAGALSFTNHWFTTNRTALGDQLTANFVGQSYGARLEGGYRYPVLPAFAVTPYGAVQFQDFNTPAYSEGDATGGGFGLSYAAMNATDVRSELGARVDDLTAVSGKPLILFGRLAWAHDFVSNPSLSAAFEALPGGGFTVNGAPIARDSALTTAGAQLFLTPSWTLVAKFDGEFAPSSQTYAGTGTLHYTW
jgi:autotransporter-associated beta strand protein